MMRINLRVIVVLSINDADYRCIINRISKGDAVKLLENADLVQKKGILQKKNFFFFNYCHI